MSSKPNAGRSDYNASAHFTQMEPGEPYFLVRGRDALGARVVRAWATLAHEALVPMAVVETALQQADAMEAWPVKKLPDAAHLSNEEVLQRAYQLERRAWSAREDSADHRILLAEERALRLAMSRVQPLLTLLFASGAWEGDHFVYQRPRDEDGKPLPGPCPIEGLSRLSTALRGTQPDLET